MEKWSSGLRYKMNKRIMKSIIRKEKIKRLFNDTIKR
jgi:hypothetical protein